jgi:hypothetical protein
VKKEIRIFDTRNNVLKVKGIRFELYEVGSGTLLSTQNSDDLAPWGGSNDWGVKLTFSPRPGPLEVYTTDPNHRYPGNTIRNLEGQNDNRIDIDLYSVPATAGGQSTMLSSTDPADITRWVGSASKWDYDEKLAVLNFIFNFMRLRVQRDITHSSALDKLVANWNDGLLKLGVNMQEVTARA